jgi:hypothetical protein
MDGAAKIPAVYREVDLRKDLLVCMVFLFYMGRFVIKTKIKGPCRGLSGIHYIMTTSGPGKGAIHHINTTSNPLVTDFNEKPLSVKL